MLPRSQFGGAATPHKFSEGFLSVANATVEISIIPKSSINRSLCPSHVAARRALPLEGGDIMTNLYVTLQNAWFNLRDREEGQTMAEYALVLALIAAVTAGIFLTLGGAIQDKLSDIQGVISGADSGS
jgi:Flp pilus assembly pilin Flp